MPKSLRDLRRLDLKNQNGKWSLFRLTDRKQFDNVSLETIEFFYRAGTEKNRIEWLMWREGFSGWRPLGELSQILKHLDSDDHELPAPPPVPDAVLKYAEEITGVRYVQEADEAEAVEESETTNPDTVSNRAIEAATSSLRLASLGPRPGKTATPKSEVVQNDVRSVKVLTMGDEATLSLMLESQSATEDRDNVRYNKIFKVRIFTPKGVLTLETVDCSTSGFRLKEPLPAGLPRFFHVEIDLGAEGKIPLICSEVREKDGRLATRVRIQVNDHMNTLKSVLLRAA